MLVLTRRQGEVMCIGEYVVTVEWVGETDVRVRVEGPTGGDPVRADPPAADARERGGETGRA
jgi:sRNA-binding carbon storage regulator CsrA